MDQQSTSHGRAFFIPRSLGEYTVTVEAVGYKNGQREVSLAIAVKMDVDVVLQRDVASNESVEPFPVSRCWHPRPRKHWIKDRRPSGKTSWMKRKNTWTRR